MRHSERPRGDLLDDIQGVESIGLGFMTHAAVRGGVSLPMTEPQPCSIGRAVCWADKQCQQAEAFSSGVRIDCILEKITESISPALNQRVFDGVAHDPAWAQDQHLPRRHLRLGREIVVDEGSDGVGFFLLVRMLNDDYLSWGSAWCRRQRHWSS